MSTPRTTVNDVKSRALLSGLSAALPIAIGYWPIAMAYGLLGKSLGLSFLHCVGMSVIVFAGASQFMALNLLAAGVGPWEIVLTTFLVNLRHFLMSASIAPKVLCSNRGLRALLAFGVTDETFAVASIKGGTLTPAYMSGLEILAYASWVTGSGAGFLVGAALPDALQASMGIALYAMFIGLFVPAAKKSRKVLILGGSAALLNGFLSLFMSGGWPIIAAVILSSLAAAYADTEKGGTAASG